MLYIGDIGEVGSYKGDFREETASISIFVLAENMIDIGVRIDNYYIQIF